jgi:hypothetical protein
MPARIEPILDADGRRMCGMCRERPAEPGHVGRRIYRCQPCYDAANRAAYARYRHSAKGAAVHERYRATEKGIASRQRNQARRIRINGRHHSTASTPQQAKAINTYIRQRLKAFHQAQRAEEPCPYPVTHDRNAS